MRQTLATFPPGHVPLGAEGTHGDRDHISGVFMFPAAKVMALESVDCQSGEFAPSPVKGLFAAAALPLVALSVEAIRQLVQ